MEAPQGLQNVGKTLTNINVPNTEQLTQGFKSVADSVSSTSGIVQDSLKDFSSQNMVNASQSFLDSNSIIAKFVFVIFIIVAFLFIVNLGINFIIYLFKHPRNPYIINGLVPGGANIVVPQDPKNTDSALVLRSNNQQNGLEATWSVWLSIDGLSNDTGKKWNHIFNKGNNIYKPSTSADSGIATVNNAPGVYVANDRNTIRIYMDDVKNNDNYVEITEIPLKKWFHLAIRIQNKTMDIYMNGTVIKRYVFENVPKQNYEQVNVGCNNGGFIGKLSNLIYYDRALNVFDINNIILLGPNLTESKAVKSNIGNYTYLSNLWYYDKLQA